MSYVQKALLSNEQVIYTAKIHWFVFAPGTALVVFGIALVVVITKGGIGPVLGTAVVLIGVVSLIKAYIQRASTELAVTTRRVIAKVGLIRRTTMELNHGKVESFHIEQSIMGRIFNFGTVVVNGTGGGKTPVPNIEAPMQFRREAMQRIDSSQAS